MIFRECGREEGEEGGKHQCWRETLLVASRVHPKQGQGLNVQLRNRALWSEGRSNQ